MFGRIREDIGCVFERDPAARSVWEVLTCYPGFPALQLHRIAHALWKAQLQWLQGFLMDATRIPTRRARPPVRTLGAPPFIEPGRRAGSGAKPGIRGRRTLRHRV